MADLNLFGAGTVVLILAGVWWLLREERHGDTRSGTAALVSAPQARRVLDRSARRAAERDLRALRESESGRGVGLPAATRAVRSADEQGAVAAGEQAARPWLRV